MLETKLHARWFFLCWIAIMFTALSEAAVQLLPFLTGLSSPIYVTSAKDGTRRLFVVERGGTIKVIPPDSTSTNVFLDIGSRILSGGERGLLGLAFHPNYSLNGRFFVNYTRAGDGATVIAEYSVSATNQNVASRTERVLLTIDQPYANHNGGMIDFGPDGYLYIGMGDGGSANDPGNVAQNVNSLLGKMLRIDVDRTNGATNYASPTNNPYFGATTGRDEIYAIGLRNPWRWSFDRGGSHQLYLADVGQEIWEEINIIVRGGNYGWKIMEGNHCNPINSDCTPPANHIPPIAEYGQTNSRCSVTGGYIYRGARGTFPAGAYISGDHCTGEIFQLYPANASGALTRLLDTSLLITSFGEDESGELYVAHLNGSVQRLALSPAPAACTYQLSETNRTFTAAGGPGNFGVAAANDCGWMAASHAGWITLSSSTTGQGNSAVQFIVAPNTNGAPRTGTIMAAGRTFTITQDAPVSLSIARTGDELNILWPTNATGYTLEATTSLQPVNWQTVTAAPAVEGTNYVVPDRVSAGNRFYRLRKP